jgi:hypothetical protein
MIIAALFNLSIYKDLMNGGSNVLNNSISLLLYILGGEILLW